jgi:hypothetical protein
MASLPLCNPDGLLPLFSPSSSSLLRPAGSLSSQMVGFLGPQRERSCSRQIQSTHPTGHRAWSCRAIRRCGLLWVLAPSDRRAPVPGCLQACEPIRCLLLVFHLSRVRPRSLAVVRPLVSTPSQLRDIVTCRPFNRPLLWLLLSVLIALRLCSPPSTAASAASFRPDCLPCARPDHHRITSARRQP